jgi:hypothetical protein
MELLLLDHAKRFEAILVIARDQFEIVGPEPQHGGLELNDGLAALRPTKVLAAMRLS